MAGRKRSSLDEAGAASELAQQLRDLRDESGLTLREVAAKSGYSPSALSLAESGRRVPTWDVTAAFVQTCGDDPGRWRKLWEVTQSAASSPSGGATAAGPPSRPAAPSPPPGPPITRERPHRRRRALAGIAALVLGIVAVITAVISYNGAHRAAPAVSSGAVSPARDGTDPYADGCKADEKQLDWKPVYRKDGSQFGTVILMFSAACQAAWGYLNGPNSAAWTTHIIAHRIPGPARAPSRFSGNAAAGSWGNVLSSRTGCVYIEAFIADRHGEGPHARTACFQPASPSANP